VSMSHRLKAFRLKPIAPLVGYSNHPKSGMQVASAYGVSDLSQSLFEDLFASEPTQKLY
jgi:hypothetical protein